MLYIIKKFAENLVTPCVLLKFYFFISYLKNSYGIHTQKNKVDKRRCQEINPFFAMTI